MQSSCDEETRSTKRNLSEWQKDQTSRDYSCGHLIGVQRKCLICHAHNDRASLWGRDSRVAASYPQTLRVFSLKSVSRCLMTSFHVQKPQFLCSAILNVILVERLSNIHLPTDDIQELHVLLNHESVVGNCGSPMKLTKKMLELPLCWMSLILLLVLFAKPKVTFSCYFLCNQVFSFVVGCKLAIIQNTEYKATTYLHLTEL